MFFDTHAHLHDPKFDADRDELCRSFKEHNVGLVLNASCCVETSYTTVEYTKRWDFVYGAVGVHPHDTKDMQDSDIDILRKLANEPKIQAIGEIGLDYYYDFTPRDIQKARFRDQLLLARELNMPVIIHDRDAHNDTLNILRDFTDLNVVFHCYSGSVEFSKILLDLGFYLSFNGAATFKNARVAPLVIEKMPLNRLMLETDCPYLTPEPYRGKRNSPAYIPVIAEKISQYAGVSVDELGKITTENGKKFFNID